MKKFLKMTVGAIIAYTVFMNVMYVPVYAYSEQDINPLLNSFHSEDAESFFLAMNLILSYYIDNNVDGDDLYNGAIAGMTEVLDEYSEYMTVDEYGDFVTNLLSSQSYFGLVMTMDLAGNIVIDEIMKESSAEEQDLIAGDVILSVDGISLKGFIPADVSKLLLDYDVVDLMILRDSEILEVSLERKEMKNVTVNIAFLDEIFELKTDGNIGYMQITTIGEDTYEEFAEGVKNLQAGGIKNLILDLRDNTGGYLDTAIDISRDIVPQGTIIYQKDSKGKILSYNSYEEKDLFENIVVLVNEYTASSAEIIASALQDSGFVLIGGQTYGKGVIQNVFSLSNGNMLKLTTGEYFRRSGEKLNGIGISPDINTASLPLDNNSQIGDIKNVLSLLGYELENQSDMLDDKTLEYINEIRTVYGYEEMGIIDEISIQVLNQEAEKKFDEKDIDLWLAVEFLSK